MRVIREGYYLTGTVLIYKEAYMKNDTMNDYEYFIVGLQVANTVDIFSKKSESNGGNNEQDKS